MQIPQTVLEQLCRQTQNYQRLIDRFIADIDFGQACVRLAEGRPCLAWLVGHLSDNTGVVCCALRKAPSQTEAYPHHFWQPRTAADWAGVKAEWAASSRRLLDILQSADDTLLAEAPEIEVHPAFRDQYTNKYAFLAGHVFHLAYHLGQMGSLRAALGLAWPVGESN